MQPGNLFHFISQQTDEVVQNPDAIEEEVKQQVVQQAVNHFAGKEEVLKQAMEKMAKYKQKYSSLNSLADIPKKKPNEMRGKPIMVSLLLNGLFPVLPFRYNARMIY